MNLFERFFKLRENRTTFHREILAGMTTFAAMSYIIVVNPLILKNAGMEQAGLITVTALAAAIMTTLMALATNYPVCMAPGMGLNAFFTFSVCLGMHVPWQAALGMVFYSGCLFFILSIAGIRKLLMDSIPNDLKIAISCGIGLFIAFIGLKNGGIITGNPETLVTLGNLSIHNPGPLLVLLGILLSAALVFHRVPGAVILPIIGITVAGLFVKGADGVALTHLPERIVGAPAPISSLFLAFDLGYLWRHFSSAFPIVLTFLFVEVFDNMGTLIAVTKRAGLMKPDGTIPRVERAFVADAGAAMIGSALGTSSVVSYIESAAGVEEGGRTGLTGLTVAACFILSLLLTPLITAVPTLATAPALVIVGILMMQGLSDLDFTDFLTVAPAFLTMLIMPLAFSISEGIGVGFISYVGIRLLAGKGRQVAPIAYGLAGLFLIHYLVR